MGFAEEGEAGGMNSQDNPFLKLEPPATSKTLTALPKLSLLQRVRYPNLYVWFVFLAAMDIMMTWIVLAFGGREANVLAHWFLARWGLQGLIGLKFASVIFVVLICEVVGRIRDAAGRNLARAAVALNVLPVLLAFLQLLINVFAGPEEPDEAVVSAVGSALALGGVALGA
ncbi:MAG: hypothetical protein C4547_08990 [Phycisphaerales bacterium]|nr:MAG: hypothetical protein C4547_08990 [Phycisphaerales bacterium]